MAVFFEAGFGMLIWRGGGQPDRLHMYTRNEHVWSAAVLNLKPDTRIQKDYELSNAGQKEHKACS